MEMTLYTQGTFDLFHYGHVAFLRNCRRLSDHVIVALLSDEAIRAYKGGAPVMNFYERERVLRACVYVDEIIESDNRNTKEEILRIKPDIVAVGSDWAKKDIYKQYGVEKEWLDQFLVYIPYTDSISTTELKERINCGTL